MNFKPVQSLQRGLRILEAVSGSRDGVALKEIAREIGCSSAAAFHLVHTLADAGYVRRIEGPARFVLGERLRGLADRQRRDAFSASAHGVMGEIAAREPQASIYLSEYVGGAVVVTATLAASSGGMLVREEKNRLLPPYASAGCLAHLAFWDQETRDDFCARYPFESYGLPYWKSRAKFDAAILAMRKQKIYRMPESSALIVKFAAPLFFPGGGLAAALTVQRNHKSKTDIALHAKRLAATTAAAAAHFTRQLEL